MSSYPWKAQANDAFASEIAVCNEVCANAAAGLMLVDELTDGWIEATDEACCPACGRLIIVGGALTGAHLHDDEGGGLDALVTIVTSASDRGCSDLELLCDSLRFSRDNFTDENGLPWSDDENARLQAWIDQLDARIVDSIRPENGR
jgi:hypothetical protein